MKFSHFFIDRPIFATVISLVITIVGVIAYLSLPSAQYPNVAPPTITITSTFPGANAEVLAKTVAQPIEQEINGVEGMLYMGSVSTMDGRSVITVTFRTGTDINQAQVLVQNRVAIAEPRLPEEVRRQGVVVRKSSPDLLLVAHLLSPDNSRDQLYISNFINLQVIDSLKRVNGVGDVTVFGARDYSMRVWLDPEKMGAIGLTTADIVTALREQNVQVAAGIIGQPPINSPEAFQFSVRTQGRLDDPKQFDQIVVKTGQDRRIVRLRDVARIELGAQNYFTNGYLSGRQAVGIGIFQLPGSNALETAKAVRARMKELSATFPPGVEFRIEFDPTVFIEESVNAVYHTIFEASILVVLVVVIFLQTWRATLIPLVAIPISLVGTFAAMSAFGFSLNNLSLFGLALAIGIVVDDAIVVVENVERHIAEGLSPRDASRKAMEEVGSAVVSVGLVLASVFVPTAFLSGITGQFYRQFALTIAFSTAISAFVSLTLSPALTTLLLPAKGAPKDWFTRLMDALFGWLFRGFEKTFGAVSHSYSQLVGMTIRKSTMALLLYGGLLALTWAGFAKVPTGFIPEQDQGYLIVDGQLPEAASLKRTDEVARKVESLALKTEGVKASVAIVGFSAATRASASNSFAVFLPLKPFEERKKAELKAAAISQRLNQELANIQEARITVIPPPPVRGLGTSGGFKLYVQDRKEAGLQSLERATNDLAEEAMKQPSISRVFSTFRTGTPQFYADIDRTKAKMLNVPLSRVFETLQALLGSTYVNDINLYGRTFQVNLQADQQYRDSPDDVRLFRVRSDTGAMVPLGSFVTLNRIVGPNRVERFNLYTSAPLIGGTKPGYSSGQSLDAMEKTSAEVLPQGMGIAWTDIAFQEKLAGNTALFIFPLCVLFVFLTLAAQYESWSLPLAIILIVPMCLLSAIAGVWFRGMDNNILTQIGFVVLVGLACKNAILIVEFARQQQELHGKDRFEAALIACQLRLRPILMTSFAFILGVLPLVLASGPGAEARQALGTAVFFGMLDVTFFGLLLTPVFFVVIQKFAHRKAVQDTGVVTH